MFLQALSNLKLKKCCISDIACSLSKRGAYASLFVSAPVSLLI
ncbi:MAG: hypothetical protein ACI84K_000318 [Pseudohongiellaceae bacterium]|jgi:hypothetical protein